MEGSQPVDRYYEAAKNIARMLYWRSDVTPEPFAKDQEDYVSELYVKALEAQQRFRTTKDDTEHEEYYVYRAMHNLRRTIVRDRWNKLKVAPYVSQELREPYRGGHIYDMEAQVFARQMLARLRKVLAQDDWIFLERTGLNNGVDYNPETATKSYNAVSIDLCNLRKKARELAK